VTRPCFALALLAACGSHDVSDHASEDSGAPVAEGARADGLCVEHGVLEALCTKCEPALAEVFKNKGDWCQEHGLPESICPTCHPERGGRPLVDVALDADEAPADGIEVRLASTIVAPAIGLATTRVTAASPEVGIEAMAQLVFDPDRVAKVTARVAGVVAKVDVAVGARVEVGQQLASLTSGDLGDWRARVQGGKARVALARAAKARQLALEEGGISSRQDLDTSRRDLAEAEAELAALEAQVRAVHSEGQGGEVRLTSPIEGVVLRRELHVGAYVEPEVVLFEIVDPSVLWAELDIPEVELPYVALGQRVAVRVDGVAEPRFGTLDYLAPEVDPRRRTTRGRMSLDNGDGRLRANMWARATVFAPRDPARVPVVVPRAAVQAAAGVKLVFVFRRGDLYEGRRVEIGRTLGGEVEVFGRLAVGDEVVTDGAFLLKTETLKDSIGAGCCDHGAGTR
jgi:cobalt-zinc-cadmium efflux system membrane fusion protein